MIHAACHFCACNAVLVVSACAKLQACQSDTNHNATAHPYRRMLRPFSLFATSLDMIAGVQIQIDLAFSHWDAARAYLTVHLSGPPFAIIVVLIAPLIPAGSLRLACLP